MRILRLRNHRTRVYADAFFSASIKNVKVWTMHTADTRAAVIATTAAADDDDDDDDDNEDVEDEDSMRNISETGKSSASAFRRSPLSVLRV